MNIQSLKKSLFIIFIVVFLIIFLSSNLDITLNQNNNNNIENVNSIKENNVIVQDELNSGSSNIKNGNKISDINNDRNNDFNYNKIDSSNINNNNINLDISNNNLDINLEDDSKSESSKDNVSNNSNNSNNKNENNYGTNNYLAKEGNEFSEKAIKETIRNNEVMTLRESVILSNYSIEECRNEIKYLLKHDITEPTIASLKLVPGYPGPRELYHSNKEYLDTKWKTEPEKNSLLLPKPHIFIHMPKTGGTSLLKVFRKNNRKINLYHNTQHPTYPELQNLPLRHTLFGHFKFGLHKYFDENKETQLQLSSDIVEPYLNPYSYLTMLRDPVDRVISHYYFLKESTGHPLHSEAANRTLIEWTAVSEASNNEFCRRMVGIDRNVETPVDFQELCIHRLKYTFKYIGIMERFDESIVLLSHKLGYTDLLFPNENVGKIKSHTKDTITPGERSIIERLNIADIRAYKIALEIFEKEIDIVGRDFLNQELIQLKKNYIEEYGPIEVFYIGDKYNQGKGNNNFNTNNSNGNGDGGNLISNNNGEINNNNNNDGGNLNNINSIESSDNSNNNVGGNLNNNNSDSDSVSNDF
ncbi:hypothetical protein DICPUDRAFT_81192 [Dictyostelium purpureum]|uniref:Sulfotransferase domain-containing protein n=1 Tax=Dictyostelium purpureum TaxID=5786 RepID=F0ZSS0_DICPU|nr:uncharacterized protein DICPUDRAFT_81192 [Dictyostelium purpureum]EGC32994.1 hypothetical protein DICPUDRAFT_81192 [Dictyostelium purpureum]|eukprot:XP_003290464.1 hypothetical protein DICPUDRAFT_81192 [Dictyostelium purpureum]